MFLWGILARLLVTKFTICLGNVKDAPGDNVPYSFREVSGLFKTSRTIWFPTRAIRQDLRFTVLIREESLTICRCNYKGRTFSLVMLRLVKESKIIVVFIHFLFYGLFLGRARTFW